MASKSCVCLYMDEQWLQPKHNGVSAEKALLAKTEVRPWYGWVSINGVRKRLMMDVSVMRVRGRRNDGATTS